RYFHVTGVQTCALPISLAVEISASMAMAMMSSTINVPKMICANGRCVILKSCRALMMIVVDDIDRMAPRNRASIADQPKARPSKIGRASCREGEEMRVE